jgi:hypothetical protein
MYARYVTIPVVGLILLAAAAGCPDRRTAPPVPADALFGTEGAGRLTYVTPEDGTLQVYDMSRNELVFAAQVTRGQEVVVDPRADRITIDGRRMLEGRLGRGNRHSIHLVPDAPATVRETVREPVREREVLPPRTDPPRR